MLISRLRLQHFRCHMDTDLEFAPLTFIVGRNNTGKSSIIDALEWVLTGACRGTDRRGAGAKTLVRAGGAERATVTVQLGAHELTRTVTRDGTSRVHPAPPAGNPEAIHLLLNGQAFLDLEHAEAKRLLLDLLDVRVTIAGQALTLAQVEEAYQDAYQQRRQAKADAAAILVFPPPAEAVPDVEALERQLRTLRLEEKALIASQSTAGGRRTELERERDRLRQGLSAPTPERPLDLAASIAALEAEIARVAQAQEAAPLTPEPVSDPGALAGQIQMLEATVARLRDQDPARGCVLERGIPCKTPAKYFTAHVDTLARLQIPALKRQVAEATAAHEAYHQERQAAWEAKAAQQRDTERLAALRTRLRMATEEAARRAEAEAQLAQIERDLADLAPAGTDALATLQARISHGEVVVAQARTLAAEALTHQETQARQRAAQERVAALEARVDQLGPKGARVAALATALGAFEARINAVLDRWGYRLAVQVDPWQVQVNDRAATLLSTSERLRVGVALSLSIAEIAATPFVALDQADLLDAGHRAMLADLLRGWDGQVVIVATKDEDWVPPVAPGVVTYRLRADPRRGTTVESYRHIRVVPELVTQGATS